MRRIFSILFYSAAGFGFYTAFFASLFLKLPMGWGGGLVFAIPSAAALFAGLWLSRFKAPARDCGVVLISVAGFCALVILNWFFVVENPEMQVFFEERLAVDYPVGIMATAFLGTIGALLLWRSISQPRDTLRFGS